MNVNAQCFVGFRRLSHWSEPQSAAVRLFSNVWRPSLRIQNLTTDNYCCVTVLRVCDTQSARSWWAITRSYAKVQAARSGWWEGLRSATRLTDACSVICRVELVSLLTVTYATSAAPVIGCRLTGEVTRQRSTGVAVCNHIKIKKYMLH
jgi:hypothetical protein